MSQETIQLQEIYLLQIDFLVSVRLRFHLNQFISLLLDILVTKGTYILIELHHLQAKLKFITSEPILSLLATLLSEPIAIVFFPDSNSRTRQYLRIYNSSSGSPSRPLL